MYSRLPGVLLLSAVFVVMTINAQTDLPLRYQRQPTTANIQTTARQRFDLPLRYRIMEELPVGTAIADLVVDAGLKRKYGPEVLGMLEYRLLQDPAPIAITVGLHTGQLATAGRIDRDELVPCRDKNICELTIDVTVRPPRYFQVIKVTIEIVDINDNEPRFRNPLQIAATMTSSPTSIVVDVRESASVYTSFALPVAVDADGPESGVRTYELIELPPSFSTGSPTIGDEGADSGTFDLKIEARPHHQLEPRLVVLRPLDRERRATYRFRLFAYDGGRPPKSGSVDVLVRIIDSNDNSPVFVDLTTASGYEANVTEDSPIGTTVVRVRAVDADEGPNADVFYRFSAHTISSAHGHLFAIGNRSGAIVIAGQLDRERHAVYQLTVIAQDQGPDAMPAEVAVIIRLIDVNDNAPVITVTTLQRSPSSLPVGGAQRVTTNTGDGLAPVTAAEVPENLAGGAFVAHVAVSDEDSGEYGRVECNITETATFSLVRRGRSTNEYQILTSQPLDREGRDRYDPVITCWDGGRPRQTSSTRLLVRITDTNDNRPLFSQPSYATRVAENSPPGTTVLRLTATDADVGVNAEVHYAVASTSITSTVDLAREGPFAIDPDDGTITVSGAGLQSPIDRERYSSFSFAVLAIDHGPGGELTGSTVVVVTIDDVNDEFPAFGTNRFSFDVDENRPETELVGIVTATDADSTRPNNVVVYRLQFEDGDDETGSGKKIARLFVIDPDTGVIRTTSSLDREQQDTYRFVVVGSDRGRPTLSSSAQVVVRVRDVNDNDPVFDDEAVGAGNSLVVIPGQIPTGSVVTRISARDADDADNGRLRYHVVTQRRRLTSSNEVISHKETTVPDDRFGIDPDTGDIIVAGSFPELSDEGTTERVEIVVFDLTIRASDCGFPANWAEREIRIVVNSSVPYLFTEHASPPARWKPEASRYHVTIIMWVVAASGLIIVVLLVLIAIVRVRSRRKLRHSRHRRSSIEEFRDRLTEARLALTSDLSAVVPEATMKRNDGLVYPVTTSFCGDELPGSTSADVLPLRLDSGSRCSSPFSHMPRSGSANMWTGSRIENKICVGNGASELSAHCGQTLPLSAETDPHHPPTASSPILHAPSAAVIVASSAAAAENERDSQHSSGEASNADSGRGQSICCGEESSTDELLVAGRILHHHPHHSHQHHLQQHLQNRSNAAGGATVSGTCCVAGPTTRTIHYLPPPPPPPRFAANCSGAVVSAHQRGTTNGWSTLSGTGHRSILAAHKEGLECRSSSDSLRRQSATMTKSVSPSPTTSHLSPLGTEVVGGRRQVRLAASKSNSLSSEQRTVAADACQLQQRDSRSSVSAGKESPAVVWHSNQNGVVV